MIMDGKKKMQASKGYDYVMSIGDQLGDYAGKWIMVYDDEIIDSDENFSVAHKKFKQKCPDKTPFVMKILKEPDMLL